VSVILPLAREDDPHGSIRIRPPAPQEE
jgi:hypothetical protein